VGKTIMKSEGKGKNQRKSLAWGVLGRKSELMRGYRRSSSPSTPCPRLSLGSSPFPTTPLSLSLTPPLSIGGN